MRIRPLSIIFTLLILSCAAQSQTTLDTDIQNLQRQVQQWQGIVQSAQGAPDQIALNLKRLHDKQRELAQVIDVRIVQIQAVLARPMNNDERELTSRRLQELLAIRTVLSPRVASNPQSGNAAAGATRARQVGAAVNESLTSSRTNGSSLIVLNPITAGDEKITGQSLPGVTRIRMEIKTIGDPDPTAGTRFSHGSASNGSTVTDVVYTPSPGVGSFFTVMLSSPVKSNQEVRAIPNGDSNRATAWLRVMPPTVRQSSPMTIKTSAATNMRRSGLATLNPPDEPPLEFITPQPGETELEKIEVKVHLTGGNAPSSIEYKLIVENNGTQINGDQVISIDRGKDLSKTVIIALKTGDNKISVVDKNDSDVRRSVIVKFVGKPASSGSEPRNTIHTRAIVGIEEAAASSGSPTQKFFIDFNLNVPLGKGTNKKDPLDANFWVWANPRITSLPQPSVTDVSDVVTGGNFFNPISNGKVKDITQGFEFLVGAEVPIIKPRDGKNIPSGFGEDYSGRIGLSFIVGAGAITPFNPQATAAVFKVNQGIIDRFPNAQGKDFVAFISADRDRFFRQYFAGLRLKTYFFKGKDHDAEPADLFPGMFDLTYGQNESVTGGKLKGGVFRLEGFYPLPFYPAVHAFGTALMKLNHGTTATPLILQAPDTIPSLSDPKLDLEVVPQIDRDYYKIGIGVDLLHLKKPKTTDNK